MRIAHTVFSYNKSYFYKQKSEPNARFFLGDPAESRTPDTLIKSQVLYQLSYEVLYGERQVRVFAVWQGQQDSNLRIAGSKPAALPTWLCPCIGSYYSGEPSRIRTCDPQFRRLLLYPAELWARESLRLTANSIRNFVLYIKTLP